MSELFKLKDTKYEIRTDYKEYKHYRDKINHLIKASKKNHNKSYFIEHKLHTQKTWEGINELIGGKVTTNNLSLIDNNKVIANQKQVANIFNNYFINVAENLSKDLGPSKSSTDKYLDNPNKFNFFITPTDPQEILNLINELDPEKGSDVYNISPKFIIDSKFFLADTLCKLFNKSTHKGKSAMNCKNYRPTTTTYIQ